MNDISPGLIMSGVWAYQTTAALKAAVDLDLFTSIGEGSHDTAALAQRTGAAERGIRILADFLTIRGILEKHGNTYQLTPGTAAFLDRRSPQYIGSTLEFMASPEMIDLAMADPAASVRNGGSIGLANISGDNPIWVKFARAMTPWATQIADLIAEQVSSWKSAPRKVLDIAAGHGIYGITIAKAVPTAEIVAVDWGIVLAVAQDNAAKFGVADRYRTLAGSAFDVDWGKDFDLVMLPNFLHHFDEKTCATLLAKVRGSLSPSGRVLASEFVPNPDRVSPPDAAGFSFAMLMTTPHGDAYTEAEYTRMARVAGFSGVSCMALAPTSQTLVEFLR
jgi:ubiquinone/menaquinone biosynthesis C-methylase UbiE